MQMQIFDTMTNEYLQATQNWFSQVQSAGMHLMVILVLIQFTLKISKSILTADGSAIGMMVNTIKHLVLISILYYLITNAGTFLPELFNSFSALGVAGSNITSLDPSSVVNEGLSIASAILQSFNSYGVLTNLAFALFGSFCCITIVICYGLIAADLMITLIESYFLVAVSSLFIAFGSTTYTLPMAREYLGMTIGVGIKLMMLYVMIAIGVDLGNDWAQLINQATQDKDWTTYLGVAVGAVIYYLIVKHVPARIASAASQAFAISHIQDTSATTAFAIGASAMVGAKMFTAVNHATAIAGGGVGLMKHLANHLSSNGPNSGASPASLPSGGGDLSSKMLTHFSDQGGSVKDVGPSSSLGGGSSGSGITPSVIHLPGPDNKGQNDLFQTT